MADDLASALKTLGAWADAINVARGGMARLTNVERDYINAKRKLDEANGAVASAAQARWEHDAAAEAAVRKLAEATKNAAQVTESAKAEAATIVSKAQTEALLKADAEYKSHQKDIERVAQQSQDKQAELLAITKQIEAKKQEHAEVHAALEAIKARFVV